MPPTVLAQTVYRGAEGLLDPLAMPDGQVAALVPGGATIDR